MIVPTVTNWAQAVMVSLTSGLVTVLSFIPAIIGAILILVAGWLLSDFVARLVTALLGRIGFETAAARTGIADFVQRAGARDVTASRVLGELVKWFIRLIFIEAAAQALHVAAVTALIERIVLWIPNLVVALVVIMIGALLASFVASLVRGAASEAGLANPNLLARLAQVAIVAFAVMVALNQIGIAANLVNTLFTAIVLAVALAVGLAFGLGGREVAGQIWQRWYDRSQTVVPRLERAAEAAERRASDERQDGAVGASTRSWAQGR